MPDTLALPWTWDAIPEWERAILQGMRDEIKRLKPRYKVDLLQPDVTITNDCWYGISIWQSTWLGASRVCHVFCAGNVLSVKSRIEYLAFDLYEPDSLDRAIDAITK